MAHLKKSNTPSSHWYKADGTPCHQLPRAKGSGLRATTLRDARKLQLFPSVTSILGIFSKPQLDRWKLQQVALASLRLERSAEESDDYYVDRLIDEAFQQVEQAADLGSRIHDAIEKHYEGVEVPQDLQAYTSPVFAWQAQKQIQFIEREKVLVNTDYGFAGTMDIACRYGQDGIGVIDFKTKKTKPGVEVKPFDGQAMQIAAYAATYWGEAKLPQVYGANVYISTTEPGRLEVCTYTPEQLVAEWEVYKLACAIWRHSKKYDPRPAAGGQRSVVATTPGGQRSVVATTPGGQRSVVATTSGGMTSASSTPGGQRSVVATPSGGMTSASSTPGGQRSVVATPTGGQRSVVATPTGGQRSVVATAPGGQRSVVATPSGGMTSASSTPGGQRSVVATVAKEAAHE